MSSHSHFSPLIPKTPLHRYAKRNLADMFYQKQNQIGNRIWLFNVWFLNHVAQLSHRHSKHQPDDVQKSASQKPDDAMQGVEGVSSASAAASSGAAAGASSGGAAASSSAAVVAASSAPADAPMAMIDASSSVNKAEEKKNCPCCRKSSCMLALYERSKGIPSSTLIDDLQKTVQHFSTRFQVRSKFVPRSLFPT